VLPRAEGAHQSADPFVRSKGPQTQTTQTDQCMEQFTNTLHLMDSLCDQLETNITTTSAKLNVFNEKLSQHATNIKEKDATMQHLQNSLKDFEGVMENVNAAFEKEVEALIGMLTCTHC
jgi:hypothetical protein